MAPFEPFAAVFKGCSTYDRDAQEEVYRGDEPANPTGIKAFTVDRHGFVENFMYFRTFCVVQSPPFVFVPSREFESSPPLVCMYVWSSHIAECGSTG